MMNDKVTVSQSSSQLSRRKFVAGSLISVAAASAAGAAITGKSLFGNLPRSAAADTPDEIVWSQCNVNCGGGCSLKWHTRNGRILYMETDNTGDNDLQARACLRGRSMRRWINSPDRLQYPQRRVGKRGEGKFERISWDEAITTIADQLKYTIEKYGNDAIHLIYATGMYATTGNPSARLLNCLGGFLAGQWDYSTNMMWAAGGYMFGAAYLPYDNVFASSFSEAEANSDLVIMFGNSPAETRMGGANVVWDFAKLREGVQGRGGRIINIDYRLNETSAGHPDEWLPIRPGTDAALVNALAYEFITNNQVDINFLHTYCVGYDEESLPASAKNQKLSYKDYIMGTGYDMVAKTPEWAAAITQIPAAQIRQLAKDIKAAKAPYVCQGWGPQRHTNGEDASRAICMLPLLIGQVGLPGTNTGQREAEPPTYLVGDIPAGDNPVTTTIPVYEWLNAVDHGKLLTATNAGVLEADKLKNDIKFIWNYAGNCLTNQHSDINLVHEILTDESKCEFILTWDTVLTDSGKYSDILLPDAMRSEQMNMRAQGYAEYFTSVSVGGPAQAPAFENRSCYDVMADIADKFGKKTQFTEGRTHDDWVKFLYEEGAAIDSEMPKWENILKTGIYKRPVPPAIGLKDFRDNPVANKLETPSGKIEIYSEDLATLATTSELEAGDSINPIPIFNPGFQGYGSITSKYPLYCCGFHHKSRTHSSFGFIPELEKVARQQIWINPIDADSRNIKNDDTCLVESPNGKIKISAKVTPRVIPGTIAIPQGAWHKANMDGDKIDEGGCVNTLTAYRPSPIGRGNGTAHSMIVQVTKA